jgi:hypothetical protein
MMKPYTYPDYYPKAVEDFAEIEESLEFYSALANLETSGRVDKLVRYLESGRTISPAVARTLAYIIAGGELRNSRNPNLERGPFAFVVEERPPPHRRVDPNTRGRAFNAAWELWGVYLQARKSGNPFSLSKEYEIARKHYNVSKEAFDSAISALEASAGKHLPRDPRGRKPKKA